MTPQAGALLNNSCPPAFPPSQLRGIRPLPKNWEAGKAGGQEGRRAGFIQQSRRQVIRLYYYIILLEYVV
jgi:hypothetical protein